MAQKRTAIIKYLLLHLSEAVQNDKKEYTLWH